MLNRAFGSPNRDQQEWLLLTCACLLKLMSGLSVSGAVFANAMRAAFALRQTELDLAVLFQYSGMLLMFIGGLVHDRWGARVTVAVGGVASTIASLAITLAFAFPTVLRGRPVWLWLLLFVYGHSLSYADLTSTAVAMCGFRASRLGRVMSAVENSFSLGAPMAALLHFLVFGNLSRPPDSQDGVGAMAVLTVFGAVAHVFAFVFVHQPILLQRPAATDAAEYELELEEQTPILSGRDRSIAEAEAEAEAEADGGHAALSNQRSKETAAEFLRATFTGCQSAPVLLLLLVFALSIAQTLSVTMNVTTVTRSLGLSGEDVKFFWVPTVLGIAWRSALGPLSDRFLLRSFHRAAALFGCLAVFGSPALLLITLPMRSGASPLGVTLSSYVLNSLLVASLFNLGPVILAQISPRRLYGRLFAACLLFGTLLALPLRVGSGLLYDRRAALVNGTVTCSGQQCYIYGNIANSACHLAAMAFCLVLSALVHARSSAGQ